MHRILLLLAILAVLLPCTMRSATPAVTTITLWPEGVPGQLATTPEKFEDNRVSGIHNPTLTLYPAPADRTNGTAIIICPGGGYGRLSMENEGLHVAQWLNSLGITALVLKYRLLEYGQPAPLRDVLRAIRYTRANAAAYGINPEHIGILGFSAGGHLASCAATLYDRPEGRTGAALDATSARPDFALLLYPVITMRAPYVHAGSRKNLLGQNPSPELIALYSTDEQVTPQTPPTFLAAGTDDQSVPVENSVQFYLALRRAGVPAELHIYQKGPHGFGMRRDVGPASDWINRAETWLRLNGWLPSPAQP